MASEPRRDPLADPLLTPENTAMVIIDYQPTQVNSVRSTDPTRMVANVVRLAQIGVAFDLPIVLSTVNVSNGTNGPTIEPLEKVLAAVETFDRTSINAWEDADFKTAVEATGRSRLIMAALWTEVCLAFPGLDAMREGYSVYPVVDAVGGTSVEAHRAGLERLYLAGAIPASVASIACELQRDWTRIETVPAFKEILVGIEEDGAKRPVAAG
jgi:nicotinamidase-related amidase